MRLPFYLFITLFFLAYLLFQTIIYLRLRPILPCGTRSRLWSGLAALILTLALPAGPWLSWQKLFLLAEPVYWAGFLWMALGMVALPLCLASFFFQFLQDGNSSYDLSRRHALAVLGLTLTGLVYGRWEAGHPVVERTAIPSAKVATRTRIVQISDLHLSQINGAEYLVRVKALVDEARPDLLVFTGDMLDSPLPDLEEVLQLFRGMPAPMGKFACTGNHEFYGNSGYKLNFIADCGFRLLRNETLTLGAVLNIAGVDDPGRAGAGFQDGRALAGAAPGLFTLLLKHRPHVHPSARGRFDLQLSGHTHNGQLLPYRPIVAARHKYMAGLYRLDWGGRVYVNRGAGTWGPPIRIMSPPEVTVIDLIPHPKT